MGWFWSRYTPQHAQSTMYVHIAAHSNGVGIYLHYSSGSCRACGYCRVSNFDKLGNVEYTIPEI